MSFRHGTGVPAHTTDIATIKDDTFTWSQRRFGSFFGMAASKHLEEADLDMGRIVNSLGRE